MTKAKENPRPDAELLALLERSPQEGTAELFDCYAGLVWSVAEKYLDNPEDIKECVNDTFLEFYLHRERFQPEKGSLKTWLAAIARNLAVSRFRKNVSREAQELKEDMAPEQDPFGGMENGIALEDIMDLERALEALPREDAGIIRMKYYDGMTVQEIAASLGLPFETVKKRQQRSLKKLRRMLTLGLIITLAAALLAACAYLALRYFGIVPGYGVVTDPEEKIYIQAEPVAAEDRYGSYTVTEATVIDGTVRIYVDIALQSEEALNEIDVLSGGDIAESLFLADVEIVCGGETYAGGAGGNFDNYPAKEEGMPPVLDRMNWHMIYMAEGVLPPEDGTLTLRFSEQELTIPMKPAAVEEQEKYGSVFYERGGLLAIARPEEEMFLVEIYPLNVGAFRISPNLIRDAHMQGRSGDIILVGEDGREYVGEQVYRGPASFSAWDFGQPEPGIYTLRVPYVFLSAEIQTEESNTIPVNLVTGQWEDRAIELPWGTVRMVSLETVAAEDVPDYGQSGGFGTGTAADGEGARQAWYHYVVRWEPPEADLEMYSAPVAMRTRFGGMWSKPASEPLPDNCFEFWCLADEAALGGGAFGDWEELLAGAQLAPGSSQSIRWNCAFEIPVVVE